jgi:hypothetical protein
MASSAKRLSRCWKQLSIPGVGAANERQVGGSHYQKHGMLQHWDIVHKFKLDYFQGQITKYVMRWKDKNGIQDLKKAAHFLEKYIELNEEKPE